MKTMIASLLAFSSVAFAAATVCDVRDYGPSGNGSTKDTQAIQKAIEACAQKAGVVYFSPGNYLTGAITLRSNITLHIEAGATLLGSPDAADYPMVPNPWRPETTTISALIYGDGVKNVTLTGLGTIDGQGLSWWKRAFIWRRSPEYESRERHYTPLVEMCSSTPSMNTALFYPPRQLERSAAAAPQAGVRESPRPRLFTCVRCTNLLMEGLTVRNSPNWTINPVFSEQIVFRGLTIDAPIDSPNTDLFDLESCRNVLISDCTMDGGDDLVTIKSGTEPAGLRINRPCENITVTNCTMLHGHGGIVFGSETSGGIRNVSVSNCVFRGTDRGFRLKSQRGRGGVVDGLVASNIVMEDVYEPFAIYFYYSSSTRTATCRPIQSVNGDSAQPVGEGTPVWRNFSFDNILAKGAITAGFILGLPESPMSGMTFSNVRIWAKDEGFLCRYAKDVAFHNVQINTGTGSTLVGQNVDGLEVDGFRTTAPHPGVPVIDLSNITDVFLRGSWAAPGTDSFLNVSGDSTRNVVLNGNDLRYAKQAVNVAREAAKEVRVQ